MEARQSTEKPADSSQGLGNKKIQTGESPVLFPSLSPWPAPDHGSSSGHRNQILLLVEFVFTPLPECFTLQILILTKLLVQVLSCPALAPICLWAAWPSVRIFGLFVIRQQVSLHLCSSERPFSFLKVSCYSCHLSPMSLSFLLMLLTLLFWFSACWPQLSHKCLACSWVCTVSAWVGLSFMGVWVAVWGQI